MIVEVYTKTNCGFCDAAKNLLRQNGIQFNELKLDFDFTRDFLVETFTTARTFPVVVINGTHVGGYHELKNIIERNSTGDGRLIME